MSPDFCATIYTHIVNFDTPITIFFSLELDIKNWSSQNLNRFEWNQTRVKKSETIWAQQLEASVTLAVDRFSVNSILSSNIYNKAL